MQHAREEQQRWVEARHRRDAWRSTSANRKYRTLWLRDRSAFVAPGSGRAAASAGGRIGQDGWRELRHGSILPEHGRVRRVAGSPQFARLPPCALTASRSSYSTVCCRSTSASRPRFFSTGLGSPIERRCAANIHRSQSPTGYSLVVPGNLADVRRADTVIVPGFIDHGRVFSDGVIDALRHVHRRGRRVVSICTGAFALAAAGVLDGLQATTHWRDIDELADRYPQRHRRPECALHRQRPSTHVGRRRERHRPVPLHRAARSRARPPQTAWPG